MISHVVKAIISFIALPFVLIHGFVNPAPVVQKPVTFGTGTYNPSGGGTYRLGSSVGTTDTSVTLSSFKEPVSGTSYTMAYLNTTILYATIDPQSTRKEFISFTGITQNSDGTATLTGVTRGLSFSYPYTAVVALAQAHPGQSIFILSDSPQHFQEYAVKRDNQTIEGIWTYASTSPPRYASVPQAHSQGNFASSTAEFASVAYVQAVSFAGVSNASESTKGIIELGTAAEAASSTILGSSGAAVVMQSRYATDTPLACVGTSCSVIATLFGTIHPNFIATSSQSTYRWGGAMFFNTSTTTLNATTSIAASTTTSPLLLNGLSYGFPSTASASSSILMTTGGTASDITWSPAFSRKIYSTTADVTDTSNSSTTLMSFTLPANYLGADGVIHIHASFDTWGANPNNMIVAVTAAGVPIGYASSTISSAVNKTLTNTGYIDAYITASAVNAQETFIRYGQDDPSGVCTTISGCGAGRTDSSTFDSTTSQAMALVLRFGTASTQTSLVFRNGYAELIR